jgi:predicted lactoylglutathione lyase
LTHIAIREAPEGGGQQSSWGQHVTDAEYGEPHWTRGRPAGGAGWYGGRRGWAGTRYVAGVEQRISLVTLGVADVARARTFYERLGWRGQEAEETVFFQAGGIAVVLWRRDKVADDAGIEDAAADGFGGMTLAHNVRSRAEVDAVLGEAARAGAAMTQPARETFYGGYAGAFTDPDGHVWEIAHNPGFPLDPDGAITVPDFGAS